MTWYIKLAILAALVAAAWFGGKAVHDSIYERGRADERAAQQAAQAAANTQQAQQDRASQRASEAVSDASSARAETVTNDTKRSTTESVERITDAFTSNPQSARPCEPDGSPAAVPDGVWRELEAATAAVAAARSPPG